MTASRHSFKVIDKDGCDVSGRAYWHLSRDGFLGGIDCNDLPIDVPEGHRVLMSTGLVDSQGREIFEGDVVEICVDGEIIECIVTWAQCGFDYYNDCDFVSEVWGGVPATITGTIHDGEVNDDGE
jgi:hypothetical protein